MNQVTLASKSALKPTPIGSPVQIGDYDKSRIMWSSPKLRKIWQPKFQEIAQEWSLTEVQSVIKGIRDGAFIFLPTSSLEHYHAHYCNDGISISVIDFHHNLARVYIGKYGEKFTQAYRNNDNEVIGELLGYPSCCINWFKSIWRGSVTEPTLSMSEHEGPIVSNILLRWAGIRYIPHLPCSGQCKATEEFGNQFRSLTSLTVQEYKDELLSWPVRWTALHGALEILLPPCKIQGHTQYTSSMVTIDRAGKIYPQYSPNGMHHPFGGAARALPRGNDYDDTKSIWSLNGFGSKESMENSHKAIAPYIATTDSDVICDLGGAGTGHLLSRLRGRRKIGVEIDTQKISSGVAGVELVQSRIQDYNIPSDVTVVIVCPTRLIELPSPNLVAQLSRISKVYVYSYRDNLNAHGGLVSECEKAGMNGQLNPLNHDKYGAIALWTSV